MQLPAGANIELDATGLEGDRSRLRMLNSDLGTLNSPNPRYSLYPGYGSWEIGRKGFWCGARMLETPYLVRVMAESFGTMQGVTFFGMPPVQSVLIPAFRN